MLLSVKDLKIHYKTRKGPVHAVDGNIDLIPTGLQQLPLQFPDGD